MFIYLKIYLICWFITNFEPISDPIDRFFLNKRNSFMMLVYDVITCFKCLVFWSALIITYDFFSAVLLSLLAQIHTKIIKIK